MRNFVACEHLFIVDTRAQSKFMIALFKLLCIDGHLSGKCNFEIGMREIPSDRKN